MRDAVVNRARMIAAVLGGSPLLFVVVIAALGGEARNDRFDLPAALAGLVALPVAWRVHAILLDRARKGRDETARADGFVVAIVVALGITEFAALLGLIAHLLSRELLPLVGLATNLILARMLWPSRERLDAFLDEPGSAAP